MLEKIDTETDLWCPAAADALREAEAIWEKLRTLPGVDWVTAGKLLARKRPRLVPIADSVILTALAPGPPIPAQQPVARDCCHFSRDNAR
jgi:hypothetical protein